MALYTFNNAVLLAQETYGQITTAKGLALMLEVWREICNAAQIEEQEESINLTDGTRGYTIDTTTQPVERIRAVYYIEDASTATELTPVSSDWMDKYAGYDWRYEVQEGTPNRYWIDAKDDGTLQIRFDPVPDTTTSGGYPIVRIYGSSYRVVTTGTDLPGIVPSPRLIAHGIKAKYAEENDPARIALWHELYEHYLAKFLEHVNRMQEDGGAPRMEFEYATNVELA